jgi:hypothetical protein
VNYPSIRIEGAVLSPGILERREDSAATTLERSLNGLQTTATPEE